ncbi:hypothetical protein R6Q57_021602 [Mikania cordata]
MSAQSEGNYAEALQNYYEAMRLEIDPYDRSYILYNIGLIHTKSLDRVPLNCLRVTGSGTPQLLKSHWIGYPSIG